MAINPLDSGPQNIQRCWEEEDSNTHHRDGIRLAGRWCAGRGFSPDVFWVSKIAACEDQVLNSFWGWLVKNRFVQMENHVSPICS